MRQRPTRSTNTHTHTQTYTHDGSSSRGFKPSRPALIQADGAEEPSVGPRRASSSPMRCDKSTFISCQTVIALIACGDVETKSFPPSVPVVFFPLFYFINDKSSEKQTLCRCVLLVVERKRNKNCKSYRNKSEQTFRTAANSVQK